ncbi:UNVERIFIED_CONTAM: hypothetical protein FKN15_063298 [Acipenser sinensis]
MPAKGKYFLNDQEPDRGSLYKQYCCISKHQLLVLLLGIAVVSCLGLLIVFFASGLIAAEHALFLSTVCSALALFLLVFILVCTESLFQRWMRFLGVAVWICLLAMGYVFIFDGKVIRAWDQVPFFLFIIFTLYTMLPFGMWEAVVLAVLSSVSHLIIVCTAVGVFDESQRFSLVFQTEYYCRLDFLWKNKNREKQEEIETMENLNRLLLENVLPAHVANLFIGDNKKNEVGALKNSSLTEKYKEFYTECDINKEGLECLRLLNEIIADFDELLSKPKFSGVEKIKTIGSTYMAATGLTGPPRHENNQDHERQHTQIGNMVEFAIALMGKLDGINRHSFNSFRLRVGINYGPVIAGVIGARKPQYDIWGNTVNVSSRMESTGQLGKIQVTEETSNVLHKLGYSCECRGLIKVKGKGELRTYFVCTDMSKSQGMALN